MKKSLHVMYALLLCCAAAGKIVRNCSNILIRLRKLGDFCLRLYELLSLLCFVHCFLLFDRASKGAAAEMMIAMEGQVGGRRLRMHSNKQASQLCCTCMQLHACDACQCVHTCTCTHMQHTQLIVQLFLLCVHRRDMQIKEHMCVRVASATSSQ